MQFSWHCGRLPDLPDLNFQILWRVVIFSMPIRLPRASQVVLVIKNPPTNARDVRDTGSIPELGRFPEGGNDNPLQYSCVENPMDRGAWWATVHRDTKSWTWLKQLSMHTHMCGSQSEANRKSVWCSRRTQEVMEQEGWPCSAVVCTARDRQLATPSQVSWPFSPFQNTRGWDSACATSMLGCRKQKQADPESSELGKDSKSTQISQLIQPTLRGFSCWLVNDIKSGVLFSPVSAIDKTEKNSSHDTDAASLSCHLPSWLESFLLCSFLFILPETVIQAKMPCGAEE